jgi:hypothetical protein
LFGLQTGIPWEDLPQSRGYGSGMTCWRHLRDGSGVFGQASYFKKPPSVEASLK